MKSKTPKVVSLGLCLVLALSLAACAKQEQVTDPGPKPDQDTVVEMENPQTEDNSGQQPQKPAEPQLPDEEPSLKELRKTLQEQSVMGGILFLGYFEEQPLSNAFFDRLEEEGYLEAYPFLESIPKERVAKTDGGEIYCIIPADPAASVAVNAWIADGGSDGQGEAGQRLYRSNSGAPFLLCGNVSDIMPNMAVSMMDSEGNSFSEYCPSISLKDGSILLPGEEEAPLLLALNQTAEEEAGQPLEVELYQGNVNADGFDVQTCTLETLNENTLVQLMIEKSVLPDTVKVLSFRREGTQLQLDLNAAFAEYVTTMGTAGEYLTVGSLVNTFLHAFGGETMTLTVEGKALETGHEIYDYALGFYQ